MKKTILLIILFKLIILNLYSQEYDPYTYQDIKPKPVLSDKVFFGGGFGMQFGSYIVIKVTPEIGYRFNSIIETGVGGYYMYFKNNYYNFSDHVYGAKVFARIFAYQNIFIQGEYEMLNITDYDLITGLYTGERVFIPGILGGIGYRQKIGQRSAILTTLLYNFSITEKTPYTNPIFRISFIY